MEKMRVVLVVVGFYLLCIVPGALCGEGNMQLEAAGPVAFSADNAAAESVVLGSVEPESGFKFRLELSSRGAAIRKAIFSGFDDRDYKNPQPLVILSPVRRADGSEILAMANADFVFVKQLLFSIALKFQGDLDRNIISKDLQGEFENNGYPLAGEARISVQEKGKRWLIDNKGKYSIKKKDEDKLNVYTDLGLALDRLHWKSFGVEKDYDGSQTVQFKADIKGSAGKPVVRLIKTYRVVPGSYHLDCTLTVENLSANEQEVRFNLAGPIGIGREGVRADMRKVVAGFRDSQGQFVSTRLDTKKLSKAETIDGRRLTKPGANFLWAAVASKYFVAILVPVPEEGKGFCDWVTDKAGGFYNPDGFADTGDETIGLDLKIASSTLAAAGETNSRRTYNFMLYLGPKDKSLFDKNDVYRELGFVHTITFMPCFCCPAAIINPLAFGILATMKWMYGFIGNYGVVIIILVFLIRIVIHPLTKKSQVSMSKMGKLAPKVEEIKRKYANNKAEMNKQVMALYKEQGTSPITGMLPMMVQMPIWIALYSAIYASIELRGASFLPIWITDLSAPDALVRFPAVIVPLLGWKIDSFNLLPILMGLAFYIQQKLMPRQAAASPQVAQQQKMMMVMMPLLFPLMLYKAPSGLNLYIMASTFAGVIEQYVIRKHTREKEEQESRGLVAATSKTGGKVKKKKPKPFYRV